MKNLTYTALLAAVLTVSACDKDDALETEKAVTETSSKASNNIEHMSSDVSDKTANLIDKTKETSKNISANITDKTADLIDKTKETSKNISTNIADKTADLIDKTKETSKNISTNIADKTADLIDKTKELGNTVSEKTKQTMISAEKMIATDENKTEPSQNDMDKMKKMAADIKGF